MSTNPRRLGKYELQELLGQGGMAEVWKALDTQLQRNVAIKLLHANLKEDPHFIGRFEREAQLIASLHHPNIVQIHDFQIITTEQDGTLAYMVMDYVEGQTLANYIRSTSSRGNYPAPEVIVQLFTSIALAVDYAHQRGMIHRDLKPANILLDQRQTTNSPIGEPILTDFGLARLMGSSAATLTAAQLGTPLYIAPEQASGFPGNERSDIYSLGIILYEMVTGTLPFQGDSATAVMAQHLRATPPSPTLFNPNIPPALEVVIMRCLAKDPAARFPSASSMAAAIAEALRVPVPESLGTPAYPVDDEYLPTYLTPSSVSNLQPATPSSPSQQVLKSATPLPPVITSPGSSPYLSASGGQTTPALSMGSNPGFSTPAYSATTPGAYMPAGFDTPGATGPAPAGGNTSFAPAQVPAAAPSQVPASAPLARRDRRSRWLLLALIALVVVLVGGSLGAYFLFLRPANPVPPAPNTIVGHAFYVSSGQLTNSNLGADGARGIADELQVDLQHVQSPPPGKSYYLWLLGDLPAPPAKDLLVPSPLHPPLLLTNNLPVQSNGTVHYLYTGDAQHNNLIAVTSRLLITLEVSGQHPASPSTNPSTWIYYAQLPQKFIPGDPTGLRGLDHIRHLYYNENRLQVLALYGGLDIWIFRNTEEILQDATSVRDDFGSPGSYATMHTLFTTILDYLDGTNNVHVDVPPGTPITANAHDAQVALLTVDATRQGVAKYFATDPPGDLDHMSLHLSELNKAPDATTQMHILSQEIVAALKNVQAWLTQVRMDTKQLFNMTPAQLTQPAAQTILDDLVTQATYAFIGQNDPITNTVKNGVLQIHYDVAKLATFDITRNVPKSLS